MKVSSLLVAFALSFVGIGCVSQEAQQRQAQAEANRRAQRESQQRASDAEVKRVLDNWHKLRSGMSIEEVDDLIGPMDQKTIGLYRNLDKLAANTGSGSAANLEYQGNHYALTFRGGKLVQWRLTP